MTENLFSCLSYFLMWLPKIEIFVYAIASMVVCGVCALIMYIIRGEG